MVAKTLKKPFYVAVESYKFARMYPLSQRDIKDLCRPKVESMDTGSPLAVVTPPVKTTAPALQSFWSAQRPPKVDLAYFSIDFTPAEYITLLFTDIGVLTSAAVSDELIRLYQ